jgi:hypothetical protein
MKQITKLLNGHYKATIDGVEITVPEAQGNRHYQMIQEAIEAGETITVEERVITVQEVKAEAYRRIIAICPEWKQRNLTAQAAQLAKKGEANWTPEEAAAWAAGEVIWNQIAAIRAASDVIEAMDPIPANLYDLPDWP